MQVLISLANAAGSVVTKEQIHREVWPGINVADGVVWRCISELRRLLGDDAEHPRFIQTISRGGYRLLAPVVAENGISDCECPECGMTNGNSRSIAVLPFVDMTPNGSLGHFCDGVSEELINALGHIWGLRVAARTSSFEFRNKSEDVRMIGKRLSVRYILEGSVRRALGKFRIAVQLIDTSNGLHVWSDILEFRKRDVFQIQDAIAQAVSHRFRQNGNVP